MSSLRDRALASVKDHTVTTVQVPEWEDVTFEVRPLTVESRNRVLQPGNNDGYLMVVIACTFDPATGEPAFTVDDLDALKQVSPLPLDRLFNAACEISGLTEAALDLGKGVS